MRLDRFHHNLAHYAHQCDKGLEEALAQQDMHAPALVAAMRYAVLGSGKRLRPFFVMESAQLFQAVTEYAVKVSVALECVHCYSLVHDDLPAMDNDVIRRGKPTVHRQFGEACAILAGDSLLALGFEILADRTAHIHADVRIALVAALARAAGASGMVGGQMLDIEAENKLLSLDDIVQLQRLKTGALFRFACEAGAILAQEDPTALRAYADHIGLCFQIKDDLLDVHATPQKLGKATQKDQEQGKATFIQALGVDGAQKRARIEHEAAIEALSHYGERARGLRQAAYFILEREQ